MRINRAAGFTLIEMLVSLSIFAVMTGFLMASFRTGKQADELRIASQVGMTVIRRTQTRALAGSTVKICRGGSRDLKICPTGAAEDCPGGICSTEVPLGYGVRFDTAAGASSAAIEYADTNGNMTYDDGEEIQKTPLSTTPNVTVKTVTPSNDGRLDIIFVPPRPTIFLNGVTTTATATIELTHSASGETRTVQLNRISGQISSD